MPQIGELKSYTDKAGNAIIYTGPPMPDAKISVTFRGAGNTLVVDAGAKVVDLSIDFSGDGGKVEIATTSKPRAGLRFNVRVGHESSVKIGPNVGCETRAFIRASEGVSVSIGEDCMLAAGVELRADDTHAIYDVRTGKRANPAASIRIGEHVWLGKAVTVMGGVDIGDGSVVGYRSTVTRDLPNNCVAAGAPARVVRRDVAWERPVLSFRRPGVDGLEAGEAKSQQWWNLTIDAEDSNEASR